MLATAVGGDRLALEPYHVAADVLREADGGGSDEAAAVVAEGRRRQEQTAADGLRVLIGELSQAGYEPRVAALLVNRAGWITDLLEYSMAWREHVPVAELLAVRDALRFAIEECNLDINEVDEKSLPDLAATAFGMSSAAIDVRLKAMGAGKAGPWRKEHRLACLAAWFTLAGLSG
jgi:hypothetical protein